MGFIEEVLNSTAINYIIMTLFIADVYFIIKHKETDHNLALKMYYAIFSIIFIALIPTLNLIFSPIISLNNGYDNKTDVEFLCTLAHSEAILYAIFFSIGLMTLELASHYYSPKVIEVFTKSWDFFILNLTYIFTIIFTSYLLLFSDVGDKKYLHNYILISFKLAVTALCFSIFYCLNTFKALMPKNIIITLSRRMKNLAFCEDLSARDVNDLVQPIDEITSRSIMRHDEETASVGIRELKSITLIESENEKIITKEIMRSICNIWNTTLAAKKYNLSMNIIEDMVDIVKNSSKKSQDTNSIDIILCLSEMADNAIMESREDLAHSIILSIKKIGNNIIESIKKTEEDDIEGKQYLINTLDQAVITLQKISKNAISKGFISGFVGVNILGELAVKSIYLNIPSIVNNSILSFKSLANLAIEKNYISNLENIINEYEVIAIELKKDSTKNEANIQELFEQIKIIKDKSAAHKDLIARMDKIIMCPAASENLF